MEFKKGDIYGTHRVISPKGVLPQPADVVDNTMEIYNNEVLIDVHTLNIDSASFTEISNRANGDVEEIKRIILEIVNTTGKHKNPWTGSGGMLIGRVAEVGPDYEGELKKGDKIATMVSLSLTPLKIDEIIEIRPEIDQVDIKGQAILFQSGIYAKLPKDIPQTLALSVLDVAGAPAQTAKICKPGDTVVVMGGGGKSGILCCWQARKQVGKKLSQMQALQFSMADLKTKIEAARLLVYRAADMKDKHLNYGEAAAMAKLYAAETAMAVTTKCVQYHGGYGYTKDYPVERMMRDAKITEIYEGTSEVQRMVIAGKTFKK